MSSQEFPVVGNWYRDFNQQLFEVVALDDAAFREVFSTSPVKRMVAENVPPPEDWTGPFGEVEVDDLGYSDMSPQSSSYSMSLEEIE